MALRAQAEAFSSEVGTGSRQENASAQLYSRGRAALVGLGLVLAGCAGPGRGLLVPVAAEPGIGHARTILAVTTRSPASDEPPGYLFSGERGDATRFASLTLSLPPERAAGSAPTDADHPDPARHIVLTASRGLERAEFTALARGPVRRRALVFTHGYNTQFDAAAIRFAQIVDDTGFEGLPILFSWPSRGGISDYGYDKDSANYSRDAMENLLATLARQPGISGIDIFAHSMGNWLTMETLRQLAIARDQKTLSRLGTIVLAAPDVDMDVFRTQIARLGPLAAHMVVYASKDDYALQLSRRLFGGKIRAGENTDLAQFRALGLAAHDLSTVEGGIGRNHGKAFGDGATIAQIGATLSAGQSARPAGQLLAGGLQTLGQSMSAIGEALLPLPAQGEMR
ncbi:alpha/beta hydrolase [Bosea sp. BK604]|uniref:alpha/beta hydrolase n=1 Tax=Bosea sp. BK604 TaxID=2512180 RepID=UPI00104BDD1C|nr:alpha/beta hydrolase [Bosea sp. BK604]TCR64575.1 esterase/lipase superfamily enzyme [Bosea sp. BK604]